MGPPDGAGGRRELASRRSRGGAAARGPRRASGAQRPLDRGSRLERPAHRRGRGNLARRGAPRDLIEIVSDDRAFDAVGDVAASLGIEFRRLSYRRLRESAGETVAEPEEQPVVASASGSRRRRRRRGGRGHASPPPAQGGDRRGPHARGGAHPVGPGPQPGGRRRPGPSHVPRPQPEAPHLTAPHDELVSVVRGLVEASPKRSVSIDALANALKSRGFQRPPGSPGS